MLDTLTAETFSEQLKTTFRIRLSDSNHIDVELTEVTPARQRPRQEQFAILFRGPRDTLLAQGTYLLEHDAIGSFDLFLVPVGMDDQGIDYEAVFNRLRK
ncbi:MAG: hypothetical protein AABN34_20055 [Acidobacteriota bacterium]